MLRTDDFSILKLCDDGLYRDIDADEASFQYGHFTFHKLLTEYMFVPIQEEHLEYYRAEKKIYLERYVAEHSINELTVEEDDVLEEEPDDTQIINYNETI